MSFEDDINATGNTPTDSLRHAISMFETEEDGHEWNNVIIIVTDPKGRMRYLTSQLIGGPLQEIGMLHGALRISNAAWDSSPTEDVGE
ncbi:hypothetical protein IIB34_02335 [PVC group bacterium]|nr:hypothetical protein [PVC group bacterium]